MLIAKAIYKEDGTLLESQIPNIVVGDKDAIRLNVSFYEDYENSKLLDLSQYVVEAVFERPDGKVSPALLLGIDVENNNKKYLIFGGWLTEVAGISKITIRIKKSGTVKATGFLPLTIQDGNAPADVVITEPQFEALENAIQAEEAARILAVQNEATARNNADSQLQANIDKEIQDRKDAISEESMYRQQQDNLINQRIDQHEEEVDTLEQEQNNKFNVVNQILNLKLNKIFSDVPNAVDLALTDYLVINAGNAAYRITIEQLQNIVSQKTDYYKGQFGSLEDLKKTIPSGEGGDYAYVDTEFTNNDGSKYYQFVMYVWDVKEARWEQTASSQYLGVTTFQAFQESLLNGTFEIGAIKGNVDLIGGEPVLKSISINGVSYSVPTIEISLSNKNIENANELGSITINNDEWNVATPTQVKELEQNTKVVEKTFKKLQVGDVIKAGTVMDYKNVSREEYSKSLSYYFNDVNDPDTGGFFNYGIVSAEWQLVIDYSNGESFSKDDEPQITFPFDAVITEIVDEGGIDEVGTWTETQLTAQEAYDNTKLKYNGTIKLQMGTPLLSGMPKGLYKLRIETTNFNITDYLFYWDEVSDFSIPVFVENTEGVINCFVNIYPDENGVIFDVCDEAFDIIPTDDLNIITLTRIL